MRLDGYSYSDDNSISLDYLGFGWKELRVVLNLKVLISAAIINDSQSKSFNVPRFHVLGDSHNDIQSLGGGGILYSCLNWYIRFLSKDELFLKDLLGYKS